MASFKKLYFYYPRYVFLAYLGYQLILIYQSQEYELSLGAVFLALTFPMVPVWFMFKFARKMSNDMDGSYLNFINYLAPVLVVAGEVYALQRAENPALGLIAAFAMGAFLFPSILCINLTIAMFAKDT